MHRKNLLLSITIAFTVSFCFPGLSLADPPTDINWGESSADRAVRDENGDLLKGKNSESETSDFVQLIYAGADEEADPPTWDGGVTGDDELIATSYIGAHRPPMFEDEGLWSSNSMHHAAVGSKLYARAWNAPNSSEWTYYGDSPDHHTVTSATTQTYGNAGNFSTTNYVGPCSSAVVEISPTSVEANTQNQAFSYYIEPTIGTSNSGINKIEITVPGTYSDVNVTGVLVGGSSTTYTDSTSGNTISVSLDSVVSADGTDLRVNFTADTPAQVDSGVNFTSTVANISNAETVSCVSGDGDGGGSVATNTWTITASVAHLSGGSSGGGCFVATAVYGASRRGRGGSWGRW